MFTLRQSDPETCRDRMIRIPAKYTVIAAGMLVMYACGDLFAQTGADKQINPFHKHYADSLKTMNYKPVFPLLARKVYKKGFDVPLPYGASITYFYMRQNIDISSTTLGFNDRDPVDLSNVIQYGNVVNATDMLTFRPDMWVLPFVNIYGILGTGSSEVAVPVISPVNFTTTQHFRINSAGLGVLLAGGVGPVFFSIDNNLDWAWIDAVEKPVPAYNFDARVGHSFVHPRHPERNLTIWAGVFYQTLRTATKGNIAMKDVMTPETAEILKQKATDAIENDPDLSAEAKHALEVLVDQGIDNLETAEVHYELDKKIAGPWNMIFGAQYQFNKSWILRCELGTFGQRSQFMLNLNYRFQIRK